MVVSDELHAYVNDCAECIVSKEIGTEQLERHFWRRALILVNANDVSDTLHTFVARLLSAFAVQKSGSEQLERHSWGAAIILASSTESVRG